MISEIKAYKPAANSIGSGQVLMSPYGHEKARLIVREMTDSLVLSLVEHGLVSDTFVLSIGYDRTSLDDDYSGEIKQDWYGRTVPKSGHGTARLKRRTSSSKLIMEAMMKLYDEIADPSLYVRRVTLTAVNVISRELSSSMDSYEQISLFHPSLQKRRMRKTKRSWKRKTGCRRRFFRFRRNTGRIPSSKAPACRKEPPAGKETNRSEATKHERAPA